MKQWYIVGVLAFVLAGCFDGEPELTYEVQQPDTMTLPPVKVQPEPKPQQKPFINPGVNYQLRGRDWYQCRPGKCRMVYNRYMENLLYGVHMRTGLSLITPGMVELTCSEIDLADRRR